MPTTDLVALPPMRDLQTRSVTDQIFEMLYARVVNLTLPPGAKLTEAEVAAQMGVSRQPVRDAFYRLSQLGFIRIRPQRATTVTPISAQAVLQAHFIRDALEQAALRTAAVRLQPSDWDALERVIARQEEASHADRRNEFHELDDRFHRDICAAAGLDFVWRLVRDTKGHMDRARYLSLSYGVANVCREHRAILTALRARDAETAAAALAGHLSHIHEILARLRTDRPGILD